MALGALVEAWMIAQEYWKFNDLGIPKKRWIEEELSDELIKCGFTEDNGDFLYMKGSKEQFSWLRQRMESGRKGGLKSQGKKSSDRLPPLSDRRPSYSYSYSDSKNKCVKEPKVSSPEELKDCIEVWGDTLRHFKINKNPNFDESSILRLIHSRGYEQTKLALIGIRSEAKTENFDPSKNVSIGRISNARLFEKFVNLGAQKRSSVDKKIKSLEDIDE